MGGFIYISLEGLSGISVARACQHLYWIIRKRGNFFFKKGRCHMSIYTKLLSRFPSIYKIIIKLI